MNKYLPLLLFVSLPFFLSCGGKDSQASLTENREAKVLLQGVWFDEENEEMTFRAEGDTIFYAESTNMPAYFRIVGDSLFLGSHSYAIERQTEHLFWFKNGNGDVVKLRKGDDTLRDQDLVSDRPTPVIMTNEVVKRDSVVFHNGERYHWYVDINPTRYKVVKSAYNDDGVSVDNVYYDNIIHLSVFKGAQKLYSADLRKQHFEKHVPKAFLEQAILGNMEFDHVDAKGFHFSATICIPDGASCYLVSTIVGFGGELSMKLLEY